jgi:leucyl-tRNA synthetase
VPAAGAGEKGIQLIAYEGPGNAADETTAQVARLTGGRALHDEIELPVQTGGMVRAWITVDADASPDQVKQIVLADAKVQAALAGRTVTKLKVVPGCIVNIVAG